MKSMNKDWYKKGWTMDIQNMSWVEDTKSEVDFLIDQLKLQGNEKILDLACGYGRHSLELARRGYDVTGIDITSEYIEYATGQAEKEGLKEKFDVVINMADGAIGYLENDMENMKIFEVVSNALKIGGKHFMDIMNGSYAETHFPCKLWDEGEKCLTLSAFEWDKKSKIMLYGQVDYPYGEPLWKPEMKEGNPIRLYTISEISKIFSTLGMSVCKSYADYTGKASSDKDIQLMVYSVRG